MLISMVLHEAIFLDQWKSFHYRLSTILTKNMLS